MKTKVAINGFGRTGRALYRAIVTRGLELEVVAVNDLGEINSLSRLLARDSVHGPLGLPVAIDGNSLVVGPQRTKILGEADAEKLPWSELGIDIVAECSGRRITRDKAEAHLVAGASRVVVSAPCKDADATFVIGVNETDFDPSRHFVVSNASCTTNCFALMAKVLQDSFGIEDGLMTTVHAYTGDQNLVDGLHKDARRSRAGLNIVPTSTGAARATGLVFPALEGHLDGTSLRVPVADGSITDFVAILGEVVAVEDLNAVFELASTGSLSGLLEYSEEPLVSSDILGSPASCIFDAGLTMSHGRLVKVFGWYDNETGYSNRLADLIGLIGSKS